jgi:predicted negative regulator of RcsB-dependent stress response
MAELKGDILVKQNKIEDAKKAYEKAYQAAPEMGLHGPTLKMKMEDLGIAIPQVIENNAKSERKEA